MATVPQPIVPAPPRPGQAEPTEASPFTPPAAPPSEHPHRRAASGIHVPGASALYVLLAALLLVGGVVALITPERLTEWFFRRERAYFDVVFEELWRLLAATLFAGAASAFALKVAADRKALNDPVVVRLQLGFFWFALLAVGLHLAHLLFVKSLSVWGLVLGAVLMGPALLLPSWTLVAGRGLGLAAAADSVGAALANVFAPRRVTLPVALYSLLTVVSTIAGLGYLIFPRLTLKWTFGYHAGKRAAFLWQWLGAGLLFLFPSMTYTLLERGIEGALWRTVPKILNAGLLIASLFHILEFGQVLAVEGVMRRWMLPLLMAHWSLVLVASAVGLALGGEPPAPAYEYEPLPSERAPV